MEGGQDDTDRKNWMKRLNWAKCREPFKTELDTITSHWIEGQLSHEQLALEMWKMWSKVRFAEGETTDAPISLDDVRQQVEILTEALCTAALNSSTSLEDRHAILNHARQHGGADNHR